MSKRGRDISVPESADSGHGAEESAQPKRPEPGRASGIVTVTFNPAIDESLTVRDFQAGAVNRVSRAVSHAGGKGVNVASFLADYGQGVTASGFLGADNSAVFERHFASHGIGDQFVRIAGATRKALKILDEEATEVTELNYPGIMPSEAEFNALLERLEELSRKHSSFVLSGSVPDGGKLNMYGRAMDLIGRNGGRCMVDTSGISFRQALEKRPFMIKPNIRELEEYLGTSLAGNAQVVQACREFFVRGIRLVVVSMGADGALFLTPHEVLHAQARAEKIVSTVGAGDAMVAGAVYALARDWPLEALARLATAFSVHALSRLEMGIDHRRDVEDIASRVVLTRVRS